MGEHGGRELARPPTNFDHYQNWIKTPEGRLWWLVAVSQHNVRFVCERCGDIVWYTKGEAMPKTLPCGWPKCYGTMTRSAPKELREFEFWQQEDVGSQEG